MAVIHIGMLEPVTSIMWVRAKGRFGKMANGIITLILMSTIQHQAGAGGSPRRLWHHLCGVIIPLHLLYVLHIDGRPIGGIRFLLMIGKSAG
jgi:hypothetical protein